MDPHNDKHLPPASSSQNYPSEPDPFRLLDLPAEIRLMIYSYAFGYRNVCWTLKPVDEDDCQLLLDDKQDENGTGDVNLSHCPVSLLQTCRTISEEAFPLFYNQSRFNIRFRPPTFMDPSRYQLDVTNISIYEFDIENFWVPGCAPSLARVVLGRIKHIRIRIDADALHYIYRVYVFSKYLDMGRQLRSLRLDFIRVSIGSQKERERISSLLCFQSYYGNALLHFHDNDPTDDNIAEFKECLRGNAQDYAISVTKKSDVLGHEKDW